MVARGRGHIVNTASAARLAPAAFAVAYTYLTTLGMKPMTAERFARVALRGVARDRAIIVTPATPRIAWWLQRTSPKAMESVNRRAAGRVRVAMAALPAAGDQS